MTCPAITMNQHPVSSNYLSTVQIKHLNQTLLSSTIASCYAETSDASQKFNDEVTAMNLIHCLSVESIGRGQHVPRRQMLA